jgi:chromate transporter
MIYIQLFISFFKIGLFGFGGGYAILPLIQHEMLVNEWLTEAEFTDIIAISQVTPGAIGINNAIFVGYTVTGNVWGALVALFAISLPSFIIMLTLCRFVLAVQGNKYVNFALVGMRPAVVGLIAAAALLLTNAQNFIDYKSVLIFGAIFFLAFKFKLHPILLIVLAGIAGVILY